MLGDIVTSIQSNFLQLRTQHRRWTHENSILCHLSHSDSHMCTLYYCSSIVGCTNSILITVPCVTVMNKPLHSTGMQMQDANKQGSSCLPKNPVPRCSQWFLNPAQWTLLCASKMEKLSLREVQRLPRSQTTSEDSETWTQEALPGYVPLLTHELVSSISRFAVYFK